MWSFGSKREDNAQLSEENIDNQERTTPIRASSDSGMKQQQPQHQQPSQKGEGNLASKSRMFYKNKKLSSSNHSSGSNAKSSPKLSGATPRTPQQDIRKKRFIGGSNNRRKSAGSKDDDYLQDVNVNETTNGIEVSFPGMESAENSSGIKRKTDRPPVISLKDQILQRQWVFKSHFSTVRLASNNDVPYSLTTNDWRPKGHRIPLLGFSSAEVGYSETLQLLKNAPIVNERSAVQKELKLLETEISSLERDRIWLEKSLQSQSATSGKNNERSDSNGVNKENIPATWNAHKLLRDDAIKKQPLAVSERNLLQKQRGNSLTIFLSNHRTRQLFVQKFGGKQNNSRSLCLFKNDDSITTILPSSNSSTDSAATTLQHVSLLAPSSKATRDGGIYFSPDVGKSQNIGELPIKLSERFEKNKADSEKIEIGDLAYLSTGSCGCYFAKFQSGESWWGSAVDDRDFHNILNAWDVYRVAFGPMDSIEYVQPGQQPPAPPNASENKRSNKSDKKTIMTNSWIILSHDGKVAWKNIPSQLSDKLDGRLTSSTAPVEVSLGPGGSYFVRFLDGSIDYSLPSKVARVCERIGERGGHITNISLHPDVSHDFVIRHTELTR